MVNNNKQIMRLDYMFTAYYDHQIEALPIYVNSLPRNKKPVMVLMIGYWELSYEVPPRQWLDMLTSIRGRVSRIFILSVPIENVNTNGSKVLLETRNEFMRTWVGEQGDPFTFVDFNALTAPTANGQRPPQPLALDKHFMCRLKWNAVKSSQKVVFGQSYASSSTTNSSVQGNGSEGGNAAPAPSPVPSVEPNTRQHSRDGGGAGDTTNDTNVASPTPAPPPEPEPEPNPAPSPSPVGDPTTDGGEIVGGSIGKIWVVEDGICADETNRNLWQVIMNTLTGLSQLGGSVLTFGGGSGGSTRHQG